MLWVEAQSSGHLETSTGVWYRLSTVIKTSLQNILIIHMNLCENRDLFEKIKVLCEYKWKQKIIEIKILWN